MRISAQKADEFSKHPPADFRVVIVYGRDAGLIHERVENLLLSVVADLNNPFQISEISGSNIKNDPARLADEARTQSLTGERRVLVINLGNEDISASLREVLSLDNIDPFIIVKAGDLGAGSPVRKLLEKDNKAATLACYEDGGSAIAGVIADMGRDAGIVFSRDAIDYLIANLGSDRLVSRREIEKLILYAGEKSEISLEDAVAIVGDSGAISIENIIYAAGSGNRQGLEKGLSRAASEGISSIVILRAAQRHFQRLQLTAAACSQGKSPMDAVNSLKPPVLFLFKKQFQHQLHIWPEDQLTKALRLLTEAEIQCKSTGNPEYAIGERMLLRLAQVAASS